MKDRANESCLMSVPVNRQRIMHLLYAEFQREWASDFALLRRTPSTQTRMFLDYFSTLDQAQKDALAEGLAERAFLSIYPEADDGRPQEGRNPAWRRYVEALPLMWDWRYEDIRGLRMRLAAAKLDPASSIGISMTEDIRKWIESIKPVKATEIRRVVKLAFSQLMNPLTVIHEGQYWEYRGPLHGRAVSITVDYSHRYYQLDYWVAAQHENRPFGGLNYGRIMGLAFAPWDCLEQANLDQSIALLKEHVVYCAGILQRLPDSYDQQAPTY